MQDEYVELIPEGLTRGVSLQEAYFLMLREKDGKRFLPSLLGRDEYEQILLAMQSRQYPRTRLMGRLAHRFGIRMESVHIFYPPKGGLSATMVFCNGETTEKMACNIAEGIVAALEQQRPILMKRTVFEEQMSRQKGEGQVSLPITAMNDRLLGEALKAAVAEENFELASLLRDELRRRESADGLSADNAGFLGSNATYND